MGTPRHPVSPTHQTDQMTDHPDPDDDLLSRIDELLDDDPDEPDDFPWTDSYSPPPPTHDPDGSVFLDQSGYLTT